MSRVQVTPLSAAPGGAPLTPEQKRFNTLIRQIEQARARLAAWQENIPLYAQAHVKLVVPLFDELAAARRKWTFALDELVAASGWTKAERSVMQELICESAADLLDDDGDGDVELKALFDKHADVDFETEQKRVRADVQQMVEAMTGVKLGDVPEDASNEDVLLHMQQKLAAQAADAQAEAEAQAEGHGRPRRKKSAAQQRREDEAQLATQSVREVFRKLASVLHPDRETDPALRESKTAMMQRANQAYAANDLLTLLELQLEIEQVDAGHVQGASPQRLKHYNKVLAELLTELKAEVEDVEMGFCIDFGLDPGRGMNPARLLTTIGENTRLLRGDIVMIERRMRMFADKAATKRWLKLEQRRLREGPFDGFF